MVAVVKYGFTERRYAGDCDINFSADKSMTFNKQKQQNSDNSILKTGSQIETSSV